MIKDWEEYNRLESLWDEGNDRIISGAGMSGIHFDIMYELGKHGINGNGREQSIIEMRKLLDDFVARKLEEQMVESL